MDGTRGAGLQRTPQIATALRKQIERYVLAFSIQRCMPGFLTRERELTKRTLSQMQFQLLFPGKLKLTVKIERKIHLHLLTVI